MVERRMQEASRGRSRAERLTSPRGRDYDHPPTRVGSAGQDSRAGRVGLGGLLLVVALALGLWFAATRGTPERSRQALDPRRGGAASEHGEAEPRALEEVAFDERETSSANPTATREEFDGQGAIRGRVQAAAGVEFPAVFAVRMGPSRSLRGRERAASRRVEFEASDGEFIVDDLPLGGYDVWVEAEGLRSARQPLLLTRGSASPYVILELSPMGFIDGFVFHADGSPAEDVLVGLQALPGEVRREVRTRADGSYRFDDVEDGEYRLHVGPADTPLVEPRELFFRAPSLRFPRTTLPPTADLRLYAQDSTGGFLDGVLISGFGSRGGRINVTTGANGQALARHLPPGRYRIQARTHYGLRTRMTYDLTLEPDQECWLVLR